VLSQLKSAEMGLVLVKSSDVQSRGSSFFLSNVHLETQLCDHLIGFHLLRFGLDSCESVPETKSLGGAPAFLLGQRRQ